MPYIPQLITALATLGGVMSTLIFTGRREAKRVDQQLGFEREKLLADERRRLFTQTSHALQRMREHLKYDEEESFLNGPGAWIRAVTKCADELYMLETELRLLAPALAEPVRDATKIARIFRDAPSKPSAETRAEFLLQYETKADYAMRQMQAVLGSELPVAQNLAAGRSRYWRYAPHSGK